MSRFDDLEEKGLIFHRQKQRGRAFMKELQKITDVIIDSAKKTDNDAYKKAMNEMHLVDSKLDEFLDGFYNEKI